jgi:hypothetical protein
VTFRFRNAGVRMLAAEEDFELAGRRFRAGSIIVPDADRARLEPMLRELGLSGRATPTAPTVRSHELDVPRIGYVHSWTRTQDEGWWRAALDAYGIPFTYFADQKLREGNLRAKYDVILFPHVGGTAVAQVNGMARAGKAPLPYKKTAETPNLGTLDWSDDIRGGMGIEGLAELAKFVREGGTLITEGSTAIIFPQYGITSGITVEEPSQLFVRGSILRGKIADPKSPLVYGYSGADLPVYFNQAPVLNAGGVGGGRGGGPTPPQSPNAGLGQFIAPNVAPLRLSPFDADQNPPPAADAARPREEDVARVRPPSDPPDSIAAVDRPRVVMRFPDNPTDMLLSGTMANGQLLAGRAIAVDDRLGDGHVVMFAIRPFWRWQTHGTYMLGFNAIMNWNDLDAGR